MTTTRRKIAVAIATRERPASCARLVDALLRQHATLESDLCVIVVDNAPSGSGLRLPADNRVILLHEPRTGIPFARNRGVSRAMGWADVIAFVDDDDLPGNADWLSNLVMTLEEHNADMATGPLKAVFPDGTPSWIRYHPIFCPRRPKHGDEVSQAYTHNLAVRADMFNKVVPWFDERLRYNGGSDAEFTQRAVTEGARIVWTKDAVVYEEFPPTRARVRWILKRSLRIGANRTKFLRIRHASAGSWALFAGGAAAEILGGGMLALFTPVIGRRLGLVGLGRAVRGIGTLLAMPGFVQVEEYRHQ